MHIQQETMAEEHKIHAAVDPRINSNLSKGYLFRLGYMDHGTPGVRVTEFLFEYIRDEMFDKNLMSDVGR